MTGQDKNAQRKAIALKYEGGPTAPRVIAKGEGFVAERIIELAQEAGIPLHDDADLVQLLSVLELDAEIPADLFQAVAEVLAFVYRLGGRTV